MNYLTFNWEGTREGRNAAKSLELSQNVLKVALPSVKEKKIVSIWNILFATEAKLKLSKSKLKAVDSHKPIYMPFGL